MILALAILMALSGGDVDASEPCSPVSTVPSSFAERTLVPGEYRIVFVATQGRRKGKSVEGRLVLRVTGADDTSPLSGGRDVADTPLYGWLEADLAGVDAPLCGDAPHPDPASKNPMSPGVLVHLVDWLEEYPENTPVLTVATLSNLRNESWRDGCGIGLFVRRIDGDSFAGDWDAWGRFHGGSGFFCVYSPEGSQ